MESLAHLPIFGALSPEAQAMLLGSAARVSLAPGESLFREGEIPTRLVVLVSGQCMLSRDALPLGEARRDQLLDAVAALGGLPHSIRANALTRCEALAWPLDSLWNMPEFANEARRYLAAAALSAQHRVEQLAAPIHYQAGSAQVRGGPFVFRDVTMVMALCEAEADWRFPVGVNPIYRAGSRTLPVFVAFADFPKSYPDDQPKAAFQYTETTVFVPVRYRRRLGLYVPYIYPSAWEPILIGREVYGFPKRLGDTIFSGQRIALRVDDQPTLDFRYAEASPTDEPRLIRALSEWVGLEGRLIETLFRVGDALLDWMGSPLYRRVTVFNHKRIPSAVSSAAKPTDAVNQLTRAVFSVTRWHAVQRLEGVSLNVTGDALGRVALRVRQAYHTRLDMRLSTAQIVRDYLIKTEETQ